MKLDYSRKAKDPTYYIAASIRKGGKVSTVPVAVIGKHSDLLSITDDPLSYAHEKVKEYNATLRRLYGQIMCNDQMIAYNKAKADVEALMRKVNGVIELSIDGEDAATCEPEEGCTGSCATCGGCH